MHSKIRLVCFDLGGVLVQITDDWKHACEIAGIETEFDLNDQLKAAFNRIIASHELAETTHDQFCKEMSEELPVNATQFDAIWRAYIRDLFPGATQLIEELNSHGYATACLSNTSDEHWKLLCDESGSIWGALNLLTYKYASQRIRLRKPDPRIYQYFEKATGFASSQIIFFDDRPENVEAAKSCGWHAELIDRKIDPIVQMRRHLIHASVLEH